MTSPYKIETDALVYLNPSGAQKFADCETKWAIPKLLGVDKRKRARPPKDEGQVDSRDRGKVMHGLIDVAVRRYAETGEVWAYEGPDGKQAAREVFRHFYESRDAVEFSEVEARELLDAARAMIPQLGLEKFEVVSLDGKPMIELDLKVTVDDLPFQAIVDVVLRHKTTGEIWVVDWKSSQTSINTRKSPNFTWLDLQLGCQRLVLEACGIRVDRSALVQVRSTAPQPPPITASRGKVTRDLNKIACDAAAYRQALVDNGEDPDDPKLAAKYEALEHCAFVRWLPDISSPAQRAHVRAELVERARRMQDIARGKRLPTSLLSNMSGHLKYTRGCDGCDFNAWCRAASNNGGEPDFSLVGIDYRYNDKAALYHPARPVLSPADARAPRVTGEVYADYCRAYGVDTSHAFKRFTP